MRGQSNASLDRGVLKEAIEGNGPQGVTIRTKTRMGVKEEHGG